MVGENILDLFLAVPTVVGTNILEVCLAVPTVVGENILDVLKLESHSRNLHLRIKCFLNYLDS